MVLINISFKWSVADSTGARIRYLEAYSLDRQTNEVKTIKLIDDE